MKKIFLMTVLSTLSLASCSDIDKESLGLSNKAPNESLVKSNSALILPPDYEYTPVNEEMTKSKNSFNNIEQEVSKKSAEEDLVALAQKELDDVKKTDIVETQELEIANKEIEVKQEIVSQKNQPQTLEIEEKSEVLSVSKISEEISQSKEELLEGLTPTEAVYLGKFDRAYAQN